MEIRHGESRTDDWAWLRNLDDPATRDYLEAENAYSNAMLEPTRALQDRLLPEIDERMPQWDLDDQWEYSWRRAPGAEQGVFVRRREPAGPEMVLLDLAESGRGRAHASLLQEGASWSGRWWAFLVDFCGYEQGTLRLRDLETGELLPKVIDDVMEFQWADRDLLLYSKKDGDRYRLFGHRPGFARDDLLHESAERFRFWQFQEQLTISRFVHGASGWECVFLGATPTEARQGHWEFIYAVHPRFHPGDLPPVHIFEGGTVRYIREGSRVRVEVERERLKRLPCEFSRHEPVYDLWPAPWPMRPGNTALRFIFESLTIPPVCYELEPSSDRPRIVQSTRIANFRPENYETRSLLVRSTDGTEVPLSLAFRGPEPRERPVLLRAYGAYGEPAPVGFRAADLSLLDRGVVIAVAHVRGGGDLGKEWYRAGYQAGKEKSIEDLIAIAGHLRTSGIAGSGLLAAHGGAAGGWLVAAAAGRRPDLFQALLLDAAPLDLISFLTDPATLDRAYACKEWGDPDLQADRRYLARLCPAENLSSRHYPAMLIRTAWHDPRVPPSGSARYVAKLRALKADRNLVLLLTRWSGGHTGPSRRSDRIREVAQQYAFLLHCFGIAD
jgi:oligopeptidase B